jgi:hypothetical protein
MVQSIYHLSDQDIKNLTVLEFYIKQKNIAKVAQLYNPYMGSEEKDKKQTVTQQSSGLGMLVKRAQKNEKKKPKIPKRRKK